MIQNMPRIMLHRLKKDRLLHLSDIDVDANGYRTWRLPTYARAYTEILSEDSPTGNDVILLPGHY